ncbi:MAG: DNA-3-methyladenine glycosylase [Beijerinckiaceae bacterium]
MPPVSIQPPHRITDEESLRIAMDLLLQSDGETIGRMLDVSGHPPLRQRDASLAGLVWIVISQQVSTASANAIHGRFRDRFGDVSASKIAAASDSDLQSCGLSRPKIRTLRHLSTAIQEGHLNLAALPDLGPDEARAALTAVKGIGPWTADIYFLFCLGHPDVWPAGDLALQEGVRQALKLRKRPDAARLEKISKRWKPWRAVAARLIWAYYGALRERQIVNPPEARPKAKRKR